jgi:hypothetical protein
MKTKIFVALTIIIACGILGYVAFTKIASSDPVGKLISFAQNFDYKPESQLAQYETCWGIFPTHCGQVLYYTIFLSLEEFQSKVDQLTSLRELPKNADGYTLLDINLVTNHTLSIDGKTDSLNRSVTPEPLAYEWLITEGGEYWIITFYETKNTGHIYEMDGQQIVGNIVTIMLQTK